MMSCIFLKSALFVWFLVWEISEHSRMMLYAGGALCGMCNAFWTSLTSGKNFNPVFLFFSRNFHLAIYYFINLTE